MNRKERARRHAVPAPVLSFTRLTTRPPLHSAGIADGGPVMLPRSPLFRLDCASPHDRADAVGSRKYPLSALVMEPSLPDALVVLGALSGPAFRVTVAEKFLEAKALLSTGQHSLLISEIRLGEYNGLHLVLHGKAHREDMAAVITSHGRDRSLQAEARRMGATFVAKPTTPAELLAAVLRTLTGAWDEGHEMDEPYERRTHDRRARRDMDVLIERRTAERRGWLPSIYGPPEG